MKWLQVTINVKKEYLEEVAAIFSELGSGGSVIEDPDLVENYTLSGHWDAWELIPDQKPVDYSVTGYFPVTKELEMTMDLLRVEIQKLADKFSDFTWSFKETLVDEEDWANVWKQYFKVVKVGQKTVVKPSWEPYQKTEEEIVIDIDPGMAFGTGNHATTTLAMTLTEKYVQEDTTVIDVGTGSGIIALQAALLGAKKVLACDYDHLAVKVASENIANNQLSDVVITRQADLLSDITLKADVLIANIVADIILRLLPQIDERLNEQGTVIVSGIIENRLDEVKTEIENHGYRILEILDSEGWYALALQRRAL